MLNTKLTYFYIRFKGLIKTKYFLVISILFLLFTLVFGSIFSFGINSFVTRFNITEIYIAETMIYSLFNIILVIYCIWNFFYEDNNDDINKMEMRIGLTKQFMYFYRLLLVFSFATIILLFEYSFNAIFYAVAFNENSLFAYRLFISSFGWLAFISFFTIFIVLFLTIIFKRKFIVVFSIIIVIILLFLSSISGNFISNKVVASNNNPISYQEKQKNMGWEGSFTPYSWDEEKDLKLGIQSTNYYEFYQTLKQEADYNFLSFLNVNYNETVTEEVNFKTFFEKVVDENKYKDINQILLDIQKQYPHEYASENIIQKLIESKNNLLIKYAEILKGNQLLKNLAKIISNENRLQNEFYQYMFDSFLTIEKGKEVDFAFNKDIKLMNQFKDKMWKNSHFNPIYHLNLMLFGNSDNFYYDNAMNIHHALFPQALNIRFDLEYEIIDSNSNKPKIKIKHSSPTQAVNSSYIVLINILIFIALSCLLYFCYKIKK